jgi:hypothetical protein
MENLNRPQSPPHTLQTLFPVTSCFQRWYWIWKVRGFMVFGRNRKICCRYLIVSQSKSFRHVSSDGKTARISVLIPAVSNIFTCINYTRLNQTFLSKLCCVKYVNTNLISHVTLRLEKLQLHNTQKKKSCVWEKSIIFILSMLLINNCLEPGNVIVTCSCVSHFQTATYYG